MNQAKVILLCILAACGYGVLHDQITARLCIEYFTVAHPPLFPTESPTLLAVCWGVAATAGVGAALGVVLALVSQSGDQEPNPISRLGGAVFILLCAMGLSALVAGCVGYWLSVRGVIALPAAFAEMIPETQVHRFMAVWFAHGASYLVGLGGGSLLCFRIWRARGCPYVISVFPRTRLAGVRAALVFIAAALILWVRFSAH